MSVSLVYRTVSVNPRKKKMEIRGRKNIAVNDNAKYAIRRKILGFFSRYETSTVKKIQAIAEEDMTKLSDTVLRTTINDENTFLDSIFLTQFSCQMFV